MSPRATASALQRISVCSIAIASGNVRGGDGRGLVRFTVRSYAETGSTNDDASPLLGTPEGAGLVLLANYQRAGRGLHARAWVAPAGSSLLFTTLLPEPVASNALWAVTFWTALGVADGIEAATGLRVGLQWPKERYSTGGNVAGLSACRGSWGPGVGRVRDGRECRAAGGGCGARCGDAAAGVSFGRGAGGRSAGRTRCDSRGLRTAVAGTRVAGCDHARVGSARGARGDAVPVVDRRYHGALEAIARRIADDGALVVDDGGIERAVSLADARVIQ